ncbi:MAG: hypothetical protein HY791_33590 [Deltaproteobacteria bacterium]|nr:hypothetical protein [Deltaproteobacteria bacterium]
MSGFGLVGGAHFMQALGVRMVEDFVDRVNTLQDAAGETLADLAGGFQQCSGMGAGALAGLLSGGGVPQAGAMPMPNMGGCPCAGSYAPPARVDFGASAPGSSFMERLGNRRAGAKLERFLKQNPFARQQVEMMLGGKIIPDGRNDGKLTVQPFPPGHFPAGGQQNAAAFSALGMLGDIANAANGLAQQLGLPGLPMGQAGGPFPGMYNTMMLGALANAAGAYNAGVAQGMQAGVQAASGSGVQRPSLGLAPGGPGKPNQPAGEEGSPDEIAKLMNDPSLTVEDKVTLMLMQICKKMDKDIEKQSQYINKIQQQQGQKGGGAGNIKGGGGGGGGGAGGAGGAGGGGGDSAPSIDVETLKLQRMVTKRQQMFDMLKAIIDKYNETAKGVIQSMGR